MLIDTKMPKPRLVWISWKDIRNPQAGGAEVVHHEISKRLLADYSIVHLVPGWPGCLSEEWVDGIRIVRSGSSVMAFASLAWRFRKEFRHKTDVLIDSFNCFGSLAFLFAKRETSKLFFIHHIQGSIWFYEYAKPFVPPINLLGWLLEKVQLLFVARTLHGRAVTVSESTRAELQKYGFRDVAIISEGTSFPHHGEMPDIDGKENCFTVLFFGGMRRMKRPMHALEAFLIFHQRHPESKLWFFGAGQENERIAKKVSRSGLGDVVRIFGRVSEEQKLHLIGRAHVLVQTSVKEGWGIAVSEAAALGTPAITYDVPGLRDSNRHGVICGSNTPEAVAEELKRLYTNITLYQSTRESAWQFSQTLSFDKSADQLKSVLNAM